MEPDVARQLLIEKVQNGWTVVDTGWCTGMRANVRWVFNDAGSLADFVRAYYTETKNSKDTTNANG